VPSEATRDPNAPIPYGDGGIARFMLDTNIYDALDADPDTLAALVRLVNHGRVEVVTVLSVFNQLFAIPDEAKRERLYAIRDQLRPRQVPATIAHLPIESLGMENTSEFAADYAALQQGKIKHTDDIAISTAAKWAGAIFVTNDDRIVRRIKRAVPTIWALNYPDFAAMVRELNPE
jgi:hypothetical protein